MIDLKRPLAELRDETVRLGHDLREMLSLRCQLAQRELRTDLAAAKWLAIVLAIAAIMALTGLPVLIVFVAEVLNQREGFGANYWLLGLGLALLGAGPLIGWLAWRRFRRGLVGFEETWEELREDALWLGEWTGRGRASRPAEEGGVQEAEDKTTAEQDNR